MFEATFMNINRFRQPLLQDAQKRILCLSLPAVCVAR
jgi:hypothetical protein